MDNQPVNLIVQLIKKLDARTTALDDEQTLDMNVVGEEFIPLDEVLTVSDTIETASYTPATFCWGNGTIQANWDWNGGGKWNAS